MLNIETYAAYWSAPMLVANFFVLLHLVGALLLGLLVGYERSYHGRAAGMRTYGLVCMASAALTVIGGFSHFWYGGTTTTTFSNGDLSRVMQGILTGIGFLCAGVIMKEGFNISGLTTAASLWAACVIGIMVGVGLYAAAMSLAVLSAICMVWVSKIEAWLPSRPAVAVNLRFDPGVVPLKSALAELAEANGYSIAGGSLNIRRDGDVHTWHFIAVAHNHRVAQPISEFSRSVGQMAGVQGFEMAYARN